MESTDLEEIWFVRLRELLEASPVVHDIVVDPVPQYIDGGIDGEAVFRIGEEEHRLLIECKSSGQPRYIRLAISQLGPHIFRSYGLTRGLVVAPFISPASRTILAEHNFGWLDLAGNVRIVFPRFHLEISKTDRDPFATKREQRSLFFPKSARLLKILLRNPQHLWKVADLVSETGVSAGQVSNVRKALIDREWAQAETAAGFRVTNPAALLDAWRDDGIQAPHVQRRGYTIKHGHTLDVAIEEAFAEAVNKNARLLLASHSVARRIAPFARVAGEFFYADSKGLELLERHLQITPTDKGENVTIFKADDDGLWLETMELGSRMRATGPIQTYLDLLSSGERGREAAEHWRAEKINPMFHTDR